MMVYTVGPLRRMTVTSESICIYDKALAAHSMPKAETTVSINATQNPTPFLHCLTTNTFCPNPLSVEVKNDPTHPY